MMICANDLQWVLQRFPSPKEGKRENEAKKPMRPCLSQGVLRTPFGNLEKVRSAFHRADKFNRNNHEHD